MTEAESLYRKGTEYLVSDPGRAIDYLTQSLALSPNAPPALYNRVVAYARVGRDAEAVEDLKQLEKLQPALGSKLRKEMMMSAVPYTDIGNSEFSAGNFEQALKKYESALAYDRRYANAWVGKGLALKALGRFGESLESFDQAVKLEPKNYFARINRAQLHYEQGHLDQAVTDYSGAIETCPDDPDAYLGRSVAYSGLHDAQKAASDKARAERLINGSSPGVLDENMQEMDYVKRLHELGCEPPGEPPNCDVEALELRIGVPLPARYREFLLRCGGWWRDVLCPCREPTPFGADHVITGFHDAAEVCGLLDWMLTPPNLITIGYGHFSKYTCLSIAGIDRGAVYALDGEFRAYWSDEQFYKRFNALGETIKQYLDLRRDDKLREKPAGYDNLYLLANDFDEFLNSCQRHSKE